MVHTRKDCQELRAACARNLGPKEKLLEKFVVAIFFPSDLPYFSYCLPSPLSTIFPLQMPRSFLSSFFLFSISALSLLFSSPPTFYFVFSFNFCFSFFLKPNEEISPLEIQNSHRIPQGSSMTYYFPLFYFQHSYPLFVKHSSLNSTQIHVCTQACVYVNTLQTRFMQLIPLQGQF